MESDSNVLVFLNVEQALWVRDHWPQMAVTALVPLLISLVWAVMASAKRGAVADWRYLGWGLLVTMGLETAASLLIGNAMIVLGHEEVRKPFALSFIALLLATWALYAIMRRTRKAIKT